MIIKCLPKFESLFYATLLSNLKGYPVVLKSTKMNLFEKEDYIDVDNLNWQQIYEDHSRRFGKIVWYEKSGNDSQQFKYFIERIAGNEKSVTKVIEHINSAIKFGVQKVSV